MASDRSSRSSQHKQIPPSKQAANTGDDELPTVNGTSIGHADTNVKNTLEELVQYPVEIEPSVEEGEEGEQEDSAPHSAESDKEDGLHDVPLTVDNPSVGFRHYEAQEDIQASPALNEHPAPSDLIQSMQQSKPIVPTALDVSVSSSPRHFLIMR
jgi:hypothetical protein